MTEANNSHEEMELYGDPGIASYNNRVPRWLLWTYFSLPIWGIVVLVIFFNGSLGWFDRGYWRELQIAANTTFPIHNASIEDLAPILKQRVPIIQEGSQKMAEKLKGHKDELEESMKTERLKKSDEIPR